MNPEFQKIWEKLKGETRRKHNAFKAVFSSPEGREVLLFILREAGTFNPAFKPGQSDWNAFREGQRQLALSIARMASVDEEQLLKELENNFKEQEYNHE